MVLAPSSEVPARRTALLTQIKKHNARHTGRRQEPSAIADWVLRNAMKQNLTGGVSGMKRSGMERREPLEKCILRSADIFSMVLAPSSEVPARRTVFKCLVWIDKS